MSHVLRDYPNVVGVGHGGRRYEGIDPVRMDPEQLEAHATDEEAITVLVEKKVAEDDLEEDEIVPKEHDNIPTDVVDLRGPLELHSEGIETWNPWHDPYPNRYDLWDPIAPGIEVQHERSDGAGCLTFIREDADGDVVGHSNEHVLAPRDVDPEPGDAILQPASGRKIGELKQFSNRQEDRDENGHMRVDTATFVLLDDVDFATKIPAIGEDQGWADSPPERGDRLINSGRTSGKTKHGLFLEDTEVEINTGNDETITFAGVQSYFGGTLPGDSGSPMCFPDGRVGGVVFAGNASFCICIPPSAITDFQGQLSVPDVEVPPPPDLYREGKQDGREEAEAECEERVAQLKAEHQDEIEALKQEHADEKEALEEYVRGVEDDLAACKERVDELENRKWWEVLFGK